MMALDPAVQLNVDRPVGFGCRIANYETCLFARCHIVAKLRYFLTKERLNKDLMKDREPFRLVESGAVGAKAEEACVIECDGDWRAASINGVVVSNGIE